MKPIASNAHSEKDFQALLRHVKERRGIDFSSYRSGTVLRRIGERLTGTGTKDCASYLLYLQENPAEMERLMNALTIRVSCFFRDPFVFEFLGGCVLPDLLRAGKPRVCGGQERLPHLLFRSENRQDNQLVPDSRSGKGETGV